MKKRIASLDIGTNTILMLIADVEDGAISVIRDEHSIARLGAGVDRNGYIQQSSFEKAVCIIRDFKNTALSEGAENIIACGTSALRDAKNSTDFKKYLHKELSIDVNVLSGSEEAEYTYFGVVSAYNENPGTTGYAVLDIGGGSTELIIGDKSKITGLHSVDIGSVRLTERILKKSPPDSAALDKAKIIVDEQISGLPKMEPNVFFIGVAGTLTTLAAIDLNLKSYDRMLIDRYVLSFNSVCRIYDDLKSLTIDRLRNCPSIHPDRADIIVAGIMILKEIMKRNNCRQIYVSDRGLRYGTLLKYDKFI